MDYLKRYLPKMKSPSVSVSSSTLCWYYTKFGKNAMKCKPPCSMSGKRFTQPVMATTGSGDDSHLFFNDCISGQCYLVDSGAEVSVLPATTSDHREKKNGSPLQTANGTHISTYGIKTFSLELEMDHKFTWTFIVADVSKPILGTDFLRHSDLLIDLARICLINRQTFSSTLLDTSHNQALTLCYLAEPSIYHSFLQTFPSLTKPCFNRSNIQHSVAHHIVTNGPPVCARFWHLSPEKPQVAKKGLDKMLALGIIGSSKSNWSSPLHIVPKTNSSVDISNA